MPRLLSAALAALFAVSCASLPPPRAPRIVLPTKTAHATVRDSLVRVTGDLIEDGEKFGYVCTGFVIAPRKVLTAAHCIQEDTPVVKVDGIAGLTIAIDEDLDLAVVLADTEKPALSFRGTPLVWMEHVFAAGYGMGLDQPLFTEHDVMLFDNTLNGDAVPGTIFLHPFIGGMSGGPVFDANGLVVGIVQRGTVFIGYGVTVRTILGFLNQPV